MERSCWWCNSCERARIRRVAWWRALPFWRFGAVRWLERRRVSSALLDASERRHASGWVGVQLSSFHGALSSGGSFYYHAS